MLSRVYRLRVALPERPVSAYFWARAFGDPAPRVLRLTGAPGSYRALVQYSSAPSTAKALKAVAHRSVAMPTLAAAEPVDYAVIAASGELGSGLPA